MREMMPQQYSLAKEFLSVYRMTNGFSKTFISFVGDIISLEIHRKTLILMKESISLILFHTLYLLW